MSTHERTLDVIKAFYDAAMDESLWPMALKDLTNVINSQAASFWVLDGSETPRLSTFICLNFDMESIKEYLQHTASIDPTVLYLVSHPQQHIVHDGLVISEREKTNIPTMLGTINTLRRVFEWSARPVSRPRSKLA